MTFMFDKFANAVLFILHECPSSPGTTVLLKLLFRADFEHYRQHLRSITGAEYVALERGPVPGRYGDLLRRLVANGYVERESIDLGLSNPMQCYKPLRQPDPAALNDTELDVLRAVVARDAAKSGVRLSKETHEELPWRAVWQDGEGEGESIPYSLARWEDNRCTEEDLEAAAQALQELSVQQALVGLR